MTYTITDYNEGVIVRAELKTLADYNTLIRKLLERRDQEFPYPQPKEDQQ